MTVTSVYTKNRTVPVTGSPTCAQPPFGGSTETTTIYYDADGNKVATTGPSGTPYQYSGTPSGCNPLTSSTCLDTTYYVYNQADRLVSTTRPADPSGNKPVTTNYYDANGNTTAITGPSGNPSTCNPVTTSSCAGTIYNTFDGAGRLASTVYTDGTPQVANSYNADGSKATVVQGTGGSANTSTYLYDGVGRLTKVTNGAGAITTYAYDTEGHRVCVSYPNATATCSPNQASDTGQTGLVTYYYNTNGQLSKMTDWLGTSFNYKYDGAGNVCAMSTGGVPSTCTSVPSGGVTESSTFDQQGSLAATTTATGATPLYKLTYTRDNNGNLATSQATIGTTVQTAANYSYDQQTQVASGPVSSGATGSTNAYTADHGITAASGFRTASYSPSGQLCWNYSSSSSNTCGSTPTGGTGFTYDASGDRLTQFTQGTGSTTTTQSLGWAQGSERLCWTLAGASSNSCGSAPTGATTYSYDASGLRISSTSGSTTTNFTWDQSTQGLLWDGAHYFIYGLNSAVPNEEISTGGSPAVSDLLVTDEIGNVRALVRLTGTTLTNTVTNVTSYDTFGNPIVASGGATESGGVSVAQTGLNSNYVDSSPFGFGEGYTDTSGMVYLVHRYFDAQSGQFVSLDPFVDRTSQPFEYASQNPQMHNDPLGLFTVGACGSFNAAALGGLFNMVALGVSICLVRTWGTPSHNDDIGWTKTTYTSAKGFAVSASVSASYNISNGNHLQDLGKSFKNISYSVLEGSALAFWGTNSHGKSIYGSDVGASKGLSLLPVSRQTYSSYTNVWQVNDKLQANLLRILWWGLVGPSVLVDSYLQSMCNIGRSFRDFSNSHYQ